MHPQAGAVHGQPQHRQDREQEQPDRGKAEEVLERLQPAVVVAE